MKHGVIGFKIKPNVVSSFPSVVPHPMQLAKKIETTIFSPDENFKTLLAIPGTEKEEPD